MMHRHLLLLLLLRNGTFHVRRPTLGLRTHLCNCLPFCLFHRAAISGDVSGAAVLGVNLTLVASWTLACNRAGMLAPDGRCKTLDAVADGYVRAEGAGGIVIRRGLTGEGQSVGRVMGVLAGSAVNQDGRSSSLTAPNGPSQQAVMRAAVAAAAMLSPQDVTRLEMHGTGGLQLSHLLCSAVALLICRHIH